MTQHTQGEWKVYNRGDKINGTYDRFRVEYADENLRSVIADINPAWLCPEHGSAQANARLIAAAPKLLEALEGLFRAVTTQSEGATKTNLRKAHAAIAAAKGEA